MMLEFWKDARASGAAFLTEFLKAFDCFKR